MTIPSGGEGHNTAGLVANVTITHDVPPHGQSDSSTATDSSVSASGSLAGEPHITIANAIAQGKSFSYSLSDAAATGLQVDQTTATPSFEWYDGSSWNSTAMTPTTVNGQAIAGSFVLPTVAGPITKARITLGVDVTTSDPLDPMATPTVDHHNLTLLDWDSTALVSQSSSTAFATNATVVIPARTAHTVEKTAKLETIDSIRGDVAVIRQANMTTAGTKGLFLAGSSLSDPSAAMDAIARLAHAQVLAQNASQYYSDKSLRFETMRQNDTVIANTYKSAVGRMTDADMAKEAAALASVQAKEQLAAQTFSIANTTPQMLLSLFR
jgi:flagellin-like hook-associated protein FlgL